MRGYIAPKPVGRRKGKRAQRKPIKAGRAPKPKPPIVKGAMMP